MPRVAAGRCCELFTTKATEFTERGLELTAAFSFVVGGQQRGIFSRITRPRNEVAFQITVLLAEPPHTSSHDQQAYQDQQVEWRDERKPRLCVRSYRKTFCARFPPARYTSLRQQFITMSKFSPRGCFFSVIFQS